MSCPTSRAPENRTNLVQNKRRRVACPRVPLSSQRTSARTRLAGEVVMTEKSKPDDSNPIARRNFLLGAGTAVATAVNPGSAAQAQQPAAMPAAGSEPASYLTLTETEVAFFTAAADTMIPADELTPSGSDCGIVIFVDRQLASAWGGGAKMYRNGPFRKAKPEYGYQLPLTPRQFFAAGVVATNAWSRKVYGKDFDRLAAKERDDALKMLEPVTFRHRPSESALPMRRMGSFLPGNTVGGAANHWGGLHWRYHPTDHLCRSHIVNRYGVKAIPEDMTIQD